MFSECIPACVQLLASDSLHSTVCYIVYPIHLCSARQHHLQISNCNATARPCCQLSRWLTLCQCMKLSLQDSIQCLLGAKVRSAGNSPFSLRLSSSLRTPHWRQCQASFGLPQKCFALQQDLSSWRCQPCSPWMLSVCMQQRSMTAQPPAHCRFCPPALPVSA